MANLIRRKLLALSAMAPVAGAMGALLAKASSGRKDAAPKALGHFAPRLSGREKVQERFLPNVPLVTHEGKKVFFYDDVVKGKIVTINFFYSKCDKICPLVTSNLVKVQKLLGGRVGRDIFMYSITLKPEEDTPQVIKEFRAMHGIQPGWTFLTGTEASIELLRRKLGFTYPDPAIDADKSQHIGNVRYGNEPLVLWAACPGQADPKWIVESILWVDRSRVQPRRKAWINEKSARTA